MRLRDLNALMRAAVRARLEESGTAKDYTQEELEDIASKVGLGALKFADLSHERSSDYVFNPESFTRFEGRTGPYLQYAAVRIQAMLARAGDEADAARPHHIVLDHPEEQGLALALLSYGDAVAAAYDRRAPHLLCDHAYSLAQTFSKFYSVCPVATAEDGDVRASRLALSKATLGQFRHVFQILGLDIPERM
jgi:arginyl-tRNA synthetase